MLLEKNEKPENAGVIFDATMETFEQDVLAASMDVPILADFWAPWCGPCKQLTPVLEEAVRAANGKVRLAKINIDENQQLAAALRIQSVPTVYAFFQGRPLDAFAGARPAGEIRALIDKLVRAAASARPDAIDIPQALGTAAQHLAAGEIESAQALYVQILEQDEKNASAFAGLVRSFIAMGALDEARGMLENAPEDFANHAELAAARTALELAAGPQADLGAIAELEKRIAAKPDDHEARCGLAEALYAAGKHEEAVDALIESIRRNRTWDEEKARKQLLKYFEALGFDHPAAVTGRKKLSSVLFS